MARAKTRRAKGPRQPRRGTSRAVQAAILVDAGKTGVAIRGTTAAGATTGTVGARTIGAGTDGAATTTRAAGADIAMAAMEIVEATGVASPVRIIQVP